jgi:hypothetical protein
VEQFFLQPVVTVPVSSTVCAGITVPATSFVSTPVGATYTWTNSNTAIGLGASGSGNVPSFVATNTSGSPISGTITVTPVLAGCTGTAATYTITVSPQCTSALVISAANGNTSYTGINNISTATVSINDDVTILSGTTRITSPDVRIITGKRITVKSGATLKVEGAWLHACTGCGNMWYGIVLEAGAILEVINASVIEDATNAVLTTATGTAPSYTINKAIFNRNTIAIKVESNSNDMSANVIKNTLITSRTLPDPNVAGFSTNFSNIKTALETNSLSSYPTSVTLAGIRSKTGVELTSITHTTAYAKIGVASTLSELNVFDNLDYGVYIVNSMCDVKNTTFQNMLGVQPHCIGCLNYPTGVGIFAPSQGTAPTTNDLIIGGTGGFADPCSFIDCFRGVEINTYYSVLAENNYFHCNSTPATVSNTVPSAGSNGIYLKNIKEVVNVNNNTFNNLITALYLQRNTSSGALNPGNIIFDQNAFYADANGYCTQAILLTDVSSNTITGVQATYIRNNLTEYVNNGIKLSYIKNNPVIYDNNVMLRYNSSGTYSGIMTEGCALAEIKNNEVHSEQSTYGTGNWDLRGIYVKTSTNNKVYCNTLYSLGQCIVFEGTSTSATASGYGIKSNSMDNARTGLMLRTSGVIGTQGNSTTPNGNTWNNSFTFDQGRTYTYNTSGLSADANTFSKLWCTAGGSTFPPSTPTNTNFTNSGAGAEYTSGSGLNTATSGSAISCPTHRITSDGFV